MSEEERDKLIKAINELFRATKRSYSLGWTVLRGVFYSIGWVIGLAFIATFLFYLLPKTGEGNIVGKFIHLMSDAISRSK